MRTQSKDTTRFEVAASIPRRPSAARAPGNRVAATAPPAGPESAAAPPGGATSADSTPPGTAARLVGPLKRLFFPQVLARPAWRARLLRLLPWLIATEALAAAGLGGWLIWRKLFAPKPPIPIRWTKAALPALAQPRIMVCKHLLTMTILDGNEPAKSYRIAVGANPGHKLKEGDKRTPEGELKVCMKNPESKYVLSLGLSYPGPADAARGLKEGLITQAQHDSILKAAREGSQPPWDTPLGGEIMIHGCRNGRQGTLGCIAVEDDEIREVYPRIPVGTRVTILP